MLAQAHNLTGLVQRSQQLRLHRPRADGGGHRQRHRLGPLRPGRRPGARATASSAAGTSPRRTTPIPTTTAPRARTARTCRASSAAATATNTGVAPGVDLVGLRVFNDAGQGLLQLDRECPAVGPHEPQQRSPTRSPRSTCRWAFRRGTPTTIPQWANLEDEFAQLKADGIFIAVSAGNSYYQLQHDGPELSRRPARMSCR